MIVKPVEGSWELSSADQFSLSASLLDEGLTPTVGMTLEITYDDGVMETYRHSSEMFRRSQSYPPYQICRQPTREL